MMIVMKEGATQAEVDAVIRRVESVGAHAHISAGELVTVIGAIGDREHVANLGLEGAPGVDHLVPILKPYKLASLQYRRGDRTVLEIDGRRIGGEHFATIAGPCTVESREVLLDAARTVRDAGAQFLRGGAYKPRTSPYSFQGLGEAGLRLLAEAKAETGLPIVTELMDVRDLEPVLEVADVVQLGARNMQNYTLLTEVGRAGKPVLLKRGLSATLEELLMAAEYILKEGNEQVMLCERGIRTYEPSYRFTLDLMAVPVLRELTHLPIVIDPSHAAGKRSLVEPLSLAAAAAGADGIIVEIHPSPEDAVCDGPQALYADDFAAYLRKLEAAAELAGKQFTTVCDAAHAASRVLPRRDRVRIAVLGVGLIGGSIGLAAREYVEDAEVVGFGRDPERLRMAVERGAIHRAAASMDEAVEGAQLCFACAPVGVLPELVRAALEASGPDTVVTDVGSTKQDLVERTPDPRFVGGHPIAGAETAGVEHARADLFQGAVWYLTPHEQSGGLLYERLHRFVVDVGARPVAVDAETHDRLVAVFSHLPHVLANVLASQAAGRLLEHGEALRQVGPSFRDMTRVAGANTAMWSDIYRSNRAAIIEEISAFRRELDEVENLLRDGGVEGWNDRARDDRRALLEAGSAEGPVHELRITVPNRPGIVAQVALELGRAGVNIVDMALAPASDMRTGAMTLWIAGDSQATRARELIEALGFPVGSE